MKPYRQVNQVANQVPHQVNASTAYERALFHAVATRRQGAPLAPPLAKEIVRRALAARGLTPAVAYAAHCAADAGLPHHAQAARSWRQAVVLALIRP